MGKAVNKTASRFRSARPRRIQNSRNRNPYYAVYCRVEDPPKLRQRLFQTISGARAYSIRGHHFQCRSCSNPPPAPRITAAKSPCSSAQSTQISACDSETAAGAKPGRIRYPRFPKKSLYVLLEHRHARPLSMPRINRPHFSPVSNSGHLQPNSSRPVRPLS